MKMTLPALMVTIVPAGMGEPMAVGPIVVAIVAIELLLYSSDLH